MWWVDLHWLPDVHLAALLLLPPHIFPLLLNGLFALGCRVISALVPAARLPLKLLWSWFLRGCFLCFLILTLLSQLLCSIFSSFFDTVVRGAAILASGPSRALCVGPLEPTGTGWGRHGAAPASPHRNRIAAPCCQHHDACTQYSEQFKFFLVYA